MLRPSAEPRASSRVMTAPGIGWRRGGGGPAGPRPHPRAHRARYREAPAPPAHGSRTEARRPKPWPAPVESQSWAFGFGTVEPDGEANVFCLQERPTRLDSPTAVDATQPHQ